MPKIPIFAILVLLTLPACRSSEPVTSSKVSCDYATASGQSRTAQSSSEFLSMLSQHLQADSIRILFAPPQVQVLPHSDESIENPATLGLSGTPAAAGGAPAAASVTLYGAHFDSESADVQSSHSVLSDSISSFAQKAAKEEHVSPQPNIGHNTSRWGTLLGTGRSILKKYVLFPLLLFLLAALLRKAGKAAIRHFIR